MNNAYVFSVLQCAPKFTAVYGVGAWLNYNQSFHAVCVVYILLWMVGI